MLTSNYCESRRNYGKSSIHARERKRNWNFTLGYHKWQPASHASTHIHIPFLSFFLSFSFIPVLSFFSFPLTLVCLQNRRVLLLFGVSCFGVIDMSAYEVNLIFIVPRPGPTYFAFCTLTRNITQTSHRSNLTNTNFTDKISFNFKFVSSKFYNKFFFCVCTLFPVIFLRLEELFKLF